MHPVDGTLRSGGTHEYVYRVPRGHYARGREADAGIVSLNRGRRAGRSAYRMCHHHSHSERWDGDYHSA